MGTKTYVFWCIIMTFWPLTAFAVGTMVGDFVMARNIVTTRVGNAFCAGAAVILCILYRVSVHILNKMDSKRNKNEENEEDKN